MNSPYSKNGSVNSGIKISYLSGFFPGEVKLSRGNKKGSAERYLGDRVNVKVPDSGGEKVKMTLGDLVKNFFMKGRGVALGFPLIFLGAVLFTINKILGVITVLIGIILLSLSDYFLENEDDELEGGL